MAKPTNKKRSPQKPSNASKKITLKGIFLGIVLGYAFAWVYSPNALIDWLQSESKLHHEPVKPASMSTELPEPKFEFYTLLSQEKPVSTFKQPQAHTPPLTRAGVASVYFVQLASFQRKEDAQEMKAKLVIQGVDAKVREITQGNSTWHRVVIGPFDERLKAEKVQGSIAERERISGLVIQVDA